MKRNYKLFLTSSSTLYFAIGLFYPFWIVFVQDFGGSIENFGFSVGLMVLASSITSYFSGKYSDRCGRKVFLIVSSFAMSGVVFSYTLITSLLHLYILQILYGVVVAIQTTMKTALLGDLTFKHSRGLDVGRYDALVGLAAAITMMGGGFVIKYVGIETIFQVTALLIFLSAVMVFFIDENMITGAKR